MIVDGVEGVPRYSVREADGRKTRYCLLIPVIDEGDRLIRELKRAQAAGVDRAVDIIICDGGSTDGSTDADILDGLGVNSLLVKEGPGKQGAQLRTGIHFALERGYDGIITIDGNDKDGIEDVPAFIEKLDAGFDFIQGSRFIPGGVARNTPKVRYLAVRLIHAPIISKTAGFTFTDTTNAFRGYSRRYLTDPRVAPLRDVFGSYELLAYLSTRAAQLGMKCCEVPVKRVYPPAQKTPTKIHPIKGNAELFDVLIANARGRYNPQ